MRYTNVHNLPPWLIERIAQEPRKKKPERMSVTDLIHTPRQRTLYIERWDDLVVDVSTMMAMWYGNLLDAAFDDDENAQKKMELQIGDITLVGKWDCMRERILQDYKFLKVGAKKYESRMFEYQAQLNIYDCLNYDINWERAEGLENHFFYKDWSPILASFDKNYPQCAWERVVQPQWSQSEQKRYILERLAYHKDKPYDCPEEDRWGSFAIKRKGGKKALVASVPGSKGKEMIKTEAHAKEILITKGYEAEFSTGEVYIENRMGLRCKFYCSVANVCKYSNQCIDKYREEK